MPGAKNGLADYLSRHPNSEAKPVSSYDSMFTVAKIKSIQRALGYKNKLGNGSSNVNNKVSNRKLANGNAVCKIRKDKPPVEGEKLCFKRTTNRNAYISIRQRSRDDLCRRVESLKREGSNARKCKSANQISVI